MRMGLVTLLKVAFDGTRVRANANRFQTWTAEKLAAALRELEALFDQAMAETERTDAAAQAAGVGEEESSLPPELATAKARRAKLKQLLAEVQAADEARRKTGIDPQKNPAQLSKTDPESKVMPNKEGGYAPNYTPLAAVDVQGDWIVDCGMLAESHEEGQTLPTVDRIEENFGQKPAAFLADAQHATGKNLAGMEERQVAFYSPVESSLPSEGNPAKRDDPRQAVPEAEWAKLPRNQQKKLAKSCTMRRQIVITVRWDACCAVSRRSAWRDGRRGESIVRGTVADARWPAFAETPTPSVGGPFRGTSTSRRGSRCTNACKAPRDKRLTPCGCMRRRRPSDLSSSCWGCGGSSYEVCRRSTRNGYGYVRRTT
jgi:hypothetical protein